MSICSTTSLERYLELHGMGDTGVEATSSRATPHLSPYVLGVSKQPYRSPHRAQKSVEDISAALNSIERELTPLRQMQVSLQANHSTRMQPSPPPPRQPSWPEARRYTPSPAPLTRAEELLNNWQQLKAKHTTVLDAAQHLHHQPSGQYVPTHRGHQRPLCSTPAIAMLDNSHRPTSSYQRTPSDHHRPLTAAPGQGNIPHSSASFPRPNYTSPSPFTHRAAPSNPTLLRSSLASLPSGVTQPPLHRSLSASLQLHQVHSSWPSSSSRPAVTTTMSTGTQTEESSFLPRTYHSHLSHLSRDSWPAPGSPASHQGGPGWGHLLQTTQPGSGMTQQQLPQATFYKEQQLNHLLTHQHGGSLSFNAQQQQQQQQGNGRGGGGEVRSQVLEALVSLLAAPPAQLSAAISRQQHSQPTASSPFQAQLQQQQPYPLHQPQQRPSQQRQLSQLPSWTTCSTQAPRCYWPPLQ
ncbi:hypothetical protein V8C86DRAFT_742827 [Haematococcus lacustris]